MTTMNQITDKAHDLAYEFLSNVMASSEDVDHQYLCLEEALKVIDGINQERGYFEDMEALRAEAPLYDRPRPGRPRKDKS